MEDFLKVCEIHKENSFYMPKKEMVTNYNVRVKLCGDNDPRVRSQ